MTPDERDQFYARAQRFMANRLRAEAARLDMLAAVSEANASIRQFVQVMADSEAREIAEQPDLAELNLQLDGYYG